MAKLIYLVGASGSGKDSLLQALREQQTTPLLVAHRYITRACHAGSENHIELSEKEFMQRRSQGLFALHWQANQHYYGLGIEIDQWLAQGISVVVNGSRAHLPIARERYGNRMQAMCLQVSQATLRQRLLARGRETPLQIEQRLQRAQDYQLPESVRCDYLNNNEDLQHTLQEFLRLVERTIAVSV
ncbi:MAG: ribose 1,5-bisphosphokinase [Hafnia sp.]|uniref:ribose 1,5-bisphosphokinase n=1 Tax=Hafnia sp. TaxID=1873498 RepID=UPI002FCB7C91